MYYLHVIYVVTVMQVLVRYFILLHMLFDTEFVKLNAQIKN